MPICGYGNRLKRISNMIGIESRKNLIPMFWTDAVIAFSQSRQIGLALNGKPTGLVTAVRHLQHEAVALSAVMNQLPANERCAIFPDHLVNMAGAAD